MGVTKVMLNSDYAAGCHPRILQRLVDTNLDKHGGYGADALSESAREKIRAACQVPTARVEFLVGGTQANAILLSALLRSTQGVIAAESGHIAVHEAGAIEAGGHKVLTLPGQDGKIVAGQLRAFVEAYFADANREHMVAPGAVYLSQPSEFGTLYSLAELREIRRICDEYSLLLYVDGARLAYALGSADNDVTLADLGRLCDVFYIGGTKCGALFGEAVVMPDPHLVPNLFSHIKQRGGLLAKGRLLGLQFDELFSDGLYEQIGRQAVAYARQIGQALTDKGIGVVFLCRATRYFAR